MITCNIYDWFSRLVQELKDTKSEAAQVKKTFEQQVDSLQQIIWNRNSEASNWKVEIEQQLQSLSQERDDARNATSYLQKNGEEHVRGIEE